jgi:S1-C subfamily serine protease
VNVADLVVVGWVVLFAASGFVRGLAAQVLALVGLVVGAVAGAWIAPHVLAGGERSPWIPLVSLTGAAVGALVVGAVTGAVRKPTARFLAARPLLHAADRAGGVVAGAAVGLALAWLGAVLFLHQPRFGLRDAVQGSRILPALVRFVPPEPVLRALNRFDPFPVLPEFAGRALPPPDASVLQSPGARAAAQSVVKIEGTSCGVGVQGSGWVVRSEIIATNAHVIGGQSDTRVFATNGQSLEAAVVYVDGGNDVALLRAEGLAPEPLPVDQSDSFPKAVAIVGYPRDGPLTATAGTAGEPRGVLAPDAYGRRVRPRTVVPLRGRVQPGESGAPVVDRRGRVIAMVFGGTERRRDGFAVPVELVTRGLGRARGPVDSGPCVR